MTGILTATSVLFSNDTFTAVRAGQPITHMRSTNSKPPNHLIHYQWTISNHTIHFFLFEKPFYSDICYNGEEYTTLSSVSCLLGVSLIIYSLFELYHISILLITYYFLSLNIYLTKYIITLIYFIGTTVSVL